MCSRNKVYLAAKLKQLSSPIPAVLPNHVFEIDEELKTWPINCPHTSFKVSHRIQPAFNAIEMTRSLCKMFICKRRLLPRDLWHGQHKRYSGAATTTIGSINIQGSFGAPCLHALRCWRPRGVFLAPEHTSHASRQIFRRKDYKTFLFSEQPKQSQCCWNSVEANTENEVCSDDSRPTQTWKLPSCNMRCNPLTTGRFEWKMSCSPRVIRAGSSSSRHHLAWICMRPRIHTRPVLCSKTSTLLGNCSTLFSQPLREIILRSAVCLL